MEILEEIFEPEKYQQEIINKDNNFRNEMDVTHRYDLRTVRSDWRTKYQEEYTDCYPIQLVNPEGHKTLWRRSGSIYHERDRSVAR